MEDLKARVEVLVEKITNLEEEILRTRARLHEVEGDRATLRLLIEQVKNLTHSLENFYTHAEDIASLAVEKVLKRKHDERQEQRKYWMGWVACGVAVLGLLLNSVFHIF